MTAVVVKHDYIPRAAFAPYHQRTQRFSVLVCHRRAGKTVSVVNDLVVRALRTRKEAWFGAYVAPFMGQARQISFAYLKKAVHKIPGIKISESETSVTFPNGSKIRVFGADNPDALRGLYFDYVVLDEIGDIPRRVWTEVIRPALADRKGGATFLGTPKGKNFFYELAEKAKHSNGQWFYLKVTADTSKIIPDSELEDLRSGMDEEEWNQEFLCSFESANKGSYYGKQMAEVERRGQLKHGVDLYVPYEKVSIAMDIGRDDATAIWFWQFVDGEIRFIDYWEESGYYAQEVCEMLELKPYTYETWWVPHDAKHNTFASKLSVIDQFREANAPARKVPDPDAGNRVLHGVNAVRKVLRTYPIVFDADRCQRGLEALRNYSRKFDNDAKVFNEKAKHDQWSHGADAFRYACLSLNAADGIELSKERAARRRAMAQATPIAPESINNDVWTFNDALEARERRLAQERSAGRTRY